MKTIQEYIKIAHLLAKKLLGSLTEEEDQQLMKWCADNKREKIYKSILSLNSAQLFNRYQEVDSEQQWENFQRRLSRRKSRFWQRFWGVAAGVCLIVGVTFFLQMYMSSSPSEQVISIENYGVQLITSNGRALNLTDRRNLDLRQVEGDVVLRNGSLEYRSNSKEEAQGSGKNTLVVPKGAFYHLILSEGTKVWLNSDSKITYPISFVGDVREVELEGEAYFEVARDDKKPFFVKTKCLQVRVLGTCFNVNAYGDNGKVYTALAEGTVEVCDVKDKSALVLTSGQVAELDVLHGQSKVRLSEISLYEQLAWKESMFCFRKMPLVEILKQIERYYDVQFVGWEKIGAEVFSGDISRNVTLEELLGAIEIQTVGLHFESTGRVVYVVEGRD